MTRTSYIISGVLLFAGIFLFAACHTADKKEKARNNAPSIITDKMQTISVCIDGNDFFNHIEEYLHTISYVKLAPVPLLAHIKDIHIVDEKIYVWDQTHQIVCYDMQGNAEFRICNIGNGPGEYTEIHAFAIDSYKGELVIYDNLRASLHYYSARDGRHLRSEKFSKPNPSEIAFFDHTFFYNNRNHRNYPTDSTLHHSLLASADGLRIDKSYFPHNKAEEEYIFSPSAQTFYDNGTFLYYCKNFDNTVYQLQKDSIIARYRIDLPNPLPFSKIKEKADEWELIRSDYSFGISNVYECDSLLYFRFHKNGYIMATLYDLAKEKQICCVKAMQNRPSPSVPLIDIINGVYKGRFYGILHPEFIEYNVSKQPRSYPDILQQYNPQSDNPMIAFYGVNVR